MRIFNWLKTKRVLIPVILITVGIVGLFIILTENNEKSFERDRERVLSKLYSAIEKAEKIGKYKCCIEPLCTMCYLGGWIWKDGTCDCDGLIAKGEWDKVCPQCIRGIKEGRCKSGISTCSTPGGGEK